MLAGIVLGEKPKESTGSDVKIEHIAVGQGNITHAHPDRMR